MLSSTFPALGVPAHPGRAARPGVPGGGGDDPPDPGRRQPRTRAAAGVADLAAVPGQQARRVGCQNCVMCSDLQCLDHVRVALVPARLWLTCGGAESRSVMSLRNASRRRGAIERTLQVKGHDRFSAPTGPAAWHRCEQEMSGPRSTGPGVFRNFRAARCLPAEARGDPWRCYEC
jgi:hypothetical protein